MIEAHNLTKKFESGEEELTVLNNINLTIKEGEYLSIKGRSGSGKSTLLHQLSLLDYPTSGEVVIDGKKTMNLSNTARQQLRLKTFGYVFQDYALLPELTALENVILTLLMAGTSHKEAAKRGLIVLDKVGVGHRPNNLPSKLSGGEQQRVSIARAIVNEPKILFADEPTANLDKANADNVMNILKELHTKGQTIVLVNHERGYDHMPDRIVEVAQGNLIESKPLTKPKKKTKLSTPNKK